MKYSSKLCGLWSEADPYGGPGFTFKKLQESAFQDDKWKWMATFSSSVWTVRFRTGNSVKRCVVVDGP